VALALVGGALTGLLQASQSDALYDGGGIADPLLAFESTLQDWVLRTPSPETYGSSVGKDPRDLITIVVMDEKSIEEVTTLGCTPTPTTNFTVLTFASRTATF
jgi:hypothetical protein